MEGGFAAPLVLIIFVSLAAVSYLLYSQNYSTQNKEPFLPRAIERGKPSVNQNIHQNKVLGFEFEYSTNFTVKEDSEEEFNQRGGGNFRKNFTGYIGYEPGKVLGAVVVLDKENNFETNPFTIWVFDNPNNLSIY